MRLTVIATLVVLGLVVSGVVVFLNVPMQVAAFNESDEVYFSKEDGLVLYVNSPSGIGSATLTAKDNHHFAAFEARLFLKALEGFVVRSGDEVHRLSVTTEGNVLLEPEGSYVLHMNELRTVGNSDYFSIYVYANNFAESVSELQLEWVDYYR